MNALLGIVISLLVGILLFVKAEIIGKAFCKLGKTIWKIGTFGITDMGMFYQEGHAKIVFKIFGILSVVWSVAYAAYIAFSSPAQ